MLNVLNLGTGTQAQGFRATVARGLAVASLLGMGLAAGAGQVLAAPDLDPNATYTYDSVQNVTIVTSPPYSIGPWQTIRQTYNCGSSYSVGQPTLLLFNNLSSPNVSAAENGIALDTSFGVLFTNWNLTAAQYQINYTCAGKLQPLVTATPGMRVHAPGDPAIYLIDDNGRKLHITDPQTYNALFRDWNGIQVADVNAIPSGPDLKGAYLAAAPGNPAIYLITSEGKRWITSPDAMNRFYFAPQQINYFPLGFLESIPSGPNLS